MRWTPRVGRVSELNDTSVAGRVRKVQEEYRAKQTRFFLTFALVEAAVLVPLILVIFVFEVIEKDLGIWILLAVAAIGGFTLTALLMRLIRQREAALNQARGITPLT